MNFNLVDLTVKHLNPYIINWMDGNGSKSDASVTVATNTPINWHLSKKITYPRMAMDQKAMHQ